MEEEGVIKFSYEWFQAPPPDEKILQALTQWRQELFHLELIGENADGFGYGNISRRAEGESFWITGSQTGHLRELLPEHYALVASTNIEENSLICKGPIKASSESLTHSALYQSEKSVGAVFHVHHQELWDALIEQGLTTPPSIPYGTPEMASAVKELLKDPTIQEKKIFAMLDHDTGVIAFGLDTDEAGTILLKNHKMVQ